MTTETPSWWIWLAVAPIILAKSGTPRPSGKAAGFLQDQNNEAARQKAWQILEKSAHETEAPSARSRSTSRPMARSGSRDCHRWASGGDCERPLLRSLVVGSVRRNSIVDSPVGRNCMDAALGGKS